MKVYWNIAYQNSIGKIGIIIDVAHFDHLKVLLTFKAI